MNKEVKIVPLVGKDIAEIEAAATAAVNEGGSVIGMTNVKVTEPFAHDVPALVIIRKAAPETIVIDEDDDGIGDAV